MTGIAPAAAHLMARSDRGRPGNASIQRAVAAAEDAADASGEIIRHFFRTRTPAKLATDIKHDLSPVTLADRGAEQAIRAVLEDSFPEDGILGEEFGAIRPGARRRWCSIRSTVRARLSPGGLFSAP